MTVYTRFYDVKLPQSQLLLYCTPCLVVVAICFSLISSWRAGLSHVPGPFLARYTDAWNIYSAWRTTRQGGKVEHYQRLQAKYGDVIRIGPRSLIVLDPAAVPIIYGVRAKLDKVLNEVYGLQIISNAE